MLSGGLAGMLTALELMLTYADVCFVHVCCHMLSAGLTYADWQARKEMIVMQNEQLELACFVHVC